MARTIAKDYAEKRLNILSVAAEVFAREGIARASMNDIAKAGRISKANIYHYYASKDALIFDILDSYLSALRDRVCQLDVSELTPPDQLHSIIREFLLAYEGMDHEHKIQTEGLPLLPENQQKILKGYQREMVQLVSGLLKQIASEAVKENPKLLHELTMSVFGMINWYYMWCPNPGKGERENYARTVTNICLNGISNF